MTPATHLASTLRPTAARLTKAAAVAAIVLATTAPACPPPPAVASPNLLCFPQATGVPNVGAASPLIDGRLSGLTPTPEFGWTSSFRYTFGNGTMVPDAAVQGIRDASNLYLSFEVNGASSPDIKDGVLIVFRPTNGVPANDRRIFIAPFQQGIALPAGPQPPTTVQYWVDSTGDAWNNPSVAAGQAVSSPAFLQNNIKVQQSLTTWWMEVKIPIVAGGTNGIANKGMDTGINFPPNGDFGFYFDILDHPAMGYIEHAWPGQGLTVGGIAAPGTNTPSSGSWGRGSLGGIQCNGVSFAWDDIEIQHPQSVNAVPPDVISVNQANRFTVTPHNATVNAAGTFIEALDVDATFKIANFGISGAGNLGDFANIPTGAQTNGNYTVPVPPSNFVQGSVLIPSSPDWSLNGPQQMQYAVPNDHQCVLVELNSNATTPKTIFLNQSVTRNMDFRTTMSPYREAVQISAGRKRTEDSDFVLVTRSYNTPLDAKWSIALEGAQQVSPGVYTLRVKAGSPGRIGTTTEPPAVAIPSQEIRVPPNAGADGRGVPIQVRSGDLITLILEGSMQVRGDKTFAGPGGAVIKADRELRPALLAPRAGGFNNVGAVIGAWNGDFKEKAVMIGGARTLKVPTGVESLVLAINDTQAGFREHTGEGFRAQVIATPLEPYMALTDSTILRNPSAEPLHIQLGANLPTMVTCGYRKTGRKISVNGVVDDLLEKGGCFGYQFNRIGR